MECLCSHRLKHSSRLASPELALTLAVREAAGKPTHRFLRARAPVFCISTFESNSLGRLMPSGIMSSVTVP